MIAPINIHRIFGVACLMAALVLMLPTATAAPKKKPEPATAQLTPAGRQLESKYNSTLEYLKGEFARTLPKIDERKKSAFLEASEATSKAAKDQATAAKTASSKATKDKEQAANELKQANEALDKARANQTKAAAALLEDLNGFLGNDKLDARIIKGAVIAHATPAGLAAFALQGSEQAALVTQLLEDEDLIKQMLVAGGAAHGNYGKAMEIYTAIRKASPRASKGHFQRLALATALEHAQPISQRNPDGLPNAPATVDPVKRYLHYEKAYLAGELDPAFKNLSAWEYRMVVNSDAPDEALAWGREMLRNYRPDHITTSDQGWRYSRLVKTDVLYGSQDVPKDDPSLQFYQNIINNGGVCGRRAFFGRFLLRGFGIPVWGVTQRAHAAVGRWTPKGWLVNLGAAYKWSWWDKDDAPRSGSDFLLETQARSIPGEYLKVLRAQWISRILGEEAYNDRRNVAGGFWSAMAHAKSEELAKGAVELGPVGADIAEANESEVVEFLEPAAITAADKKITVSNDGIITIPAVACEKPDRGIQIMNSYAGGGQLHIGRELKEDKTFHYSISVPKSGSYELKARIVTVQANQKLLVKVVNSMKAIEIPLPYTIGLWRDTAPVTLNLEKGQIDLQFTRPADPGRGVTLKEFTLTPVR